MSKFTLILMCSVAASLCGIYAYTSEEKKIIHEEIKSVVAECAKAHGVTQEQINAALEAGHGRNINPCFFACLFKQIGTMSPQGIYNADTALNVLKNIVSDEEFPKYQEKGRNCGSVNTQLVSDGEAGCERAKLILACWLEQGVEFTM